MCVDSPGKPSGSSLPQPFPKDTVGLRKAPKDRTGREGLSSGLTARYMLLDADHSLVLSCI